MQQPGLVALPEFTLASVDRRGVVRVNGDPGVDGMMVGRSGDSAARRLRARRRGKGKADDHGAAALEQAASRQSLDAIVLDDFRWGNHVVHVSPPSTF